MFDRHPKICITCGRSIRGHQFQKLSLLTDNQIEKPYCKVIIPAPLMVRDNCDRNSVLSIDCKYSGATQSPE